MFERDHPPFDRPEDRSVDMQMSSRQEQRRRLLMLLSAYSTTLVACGSGGSGEEDSPGGPVGDPTPSPTQAPGPPPAPTQAPAPVPIPPTAPAPPVIASLAAGRWLELPNTKIRSVLPSPVPDGQWGPEAICGAWNGGTVDTVRHRLLIWGGGHDDYYGNEMYAVDLSSMSVQRIVDPSPHTASSNCSSTALPDGTPTARHTYGGLVYIPQTDTFMAVDGSRSPCGYMDETTWLYSFATSTWTRVNPNVSMPGEPGTMAAYDSVSQKVFVKKLSNFWEFDPATSRFTKRNSVSQNVDYHLSAAIDPKRRRFVMVGNGVQVVNLNTFTMSAMTTSNSPGFVTAQTSPGIAYDPVGDRMVAWHGGANVYALNMDTGAWTQVASGPGPNGGAQGNGTFGRWGYVPGYRVFVMVNGIDENAWVFRPPATYP